INDVVLEVISLSAAHLELNLEVAAGSSFHGVTPLRAVVVQSVVDKDVGVTAPPSIAVAALAGCFCVASDGDAAGICVIEQVVPHGRVPAVTRRSAFGGSSRSRISTRPLGAISQTHLIFAGRLDGVVGLKNNVILEGDIRTAVTIEPIGVVGAALTGILYSADVIDCVPTDFPMHSLVMSDGTDALISNRVNADVVIVVNQVIRDSKIGDISVYVHRLAASGFQIVDFVAADDELSNGGLRRSVDRDAESIAVFFRLGRDVVHQIVQKLDAAARTGDPYAGRSYGGLAGGVVTDLKSIDDDVALARDIDQTLNAGWVQSGAIDDRRLSRIARKCDRLRFRSGIRKGD